jgi:hypothetical protein
MSTHNTEQAIMIKSDRPHEVHMPEGSHIAASPTGDAGTPSVRKVLTGPDQIIAEHMVLDVVKSTTSEKISTLEIKYPKYKGYQDKVEQADKFVSELKKPSISPTALKPVDIQKQLDSLFQTKETAPSVEPLMKHVSLAGLKQKSPSPSELEEMPEMDFPARVINLKIENDMIRTRLDDLE